MHKNRAKYWTTILAVCILLNLSPRAATPAAAPAAGLESPLQQPGIPNDPSRLEAYLDQYFGRWIGRGKVPGAVVTFVQDGDVILSKGYGFANLETGGRVDPGETIWRVMSISKLVTAVAVLQLYEAGKLNLDADVRPWLPGVPFRGRDFGPITARQLLTHTAGLDYDLDQIGALPDTPEDLLPLAGFFTEFPPRRVAPTGEHYLYSNAAFDLLGLLVENISGLPFEQYVQANIFIPLGMKDSSFHQPPPGFERMARSYAPGEQGPIAFADPYFQGGPSRSMSATASDMGNWMLALLNRGRLAEAQVLKPESVDLLFSRAFSYSQELPGTAFGFDEWAVAGEHLALSKYGGGEGTTSQVFLLPEFGVGYFFAYNLEDDFELGDDFPEMFLRRYYPARHPPAAQGQQPDVDGIAGVYRPVDYSRATIAKVLRLAGDGYPRVQVTATGLPEVRFGPDEEWRTLVPISPQKFLAPAISRQYIFIRDASGRVTHLVSGTYVAEKVAWWDRDSLHLGLVVFFVVFFALGTMIFGWAARAGRMQNPARRRLFAALSLIAGLNLVFLVVLMSVLQFIALDYGPGMPWFMVLLLGLALATSIGVTGMPVWLAGLWWRGTVRGRGLLAAGVSIIVMAGFVAWLNFWNLLGFNW